MQCSTSPGALSLRKWLWCTCSTSCCQNCDWSLEVLQAAGRAVVLSLVIDRAMGPYICLLWRCVARTTPLGPALGFTRSCRVPLCRALQQGKPAHLLLLLTLLVLPGDQASRQGTRDGWRGAPREPHSQNLDGAEAGRCCSATGRSDRLRNRLFGMHRLSGSYVRAPKLSCELLILFFSQDPR